MINYRTISLVAFISTVAISCSPSYKKYISSYQNQVNRVAPDYSNFDDWAAHPWKKDPSDSIPKPFQKTYQLDTTIDVFFVHPTTLTDTANFRWNADITDASINAKTDYGTILYQASAFNEYRVFAPRYRQAHIRSYFTTDTANALKAFELAYRDVKTAFEYYLKHFNSGKPIIIASHSQGSTHAQRLLKEYFDNGVLQKKLVAAYVIGMYIPDNYFSQLNVCTDSSQPGCICAWRTYKKGFLPPFVQKEAKTKWVTNPLSGSNNTAYIGSAFNKGSVLKKFNRTSKGVTDAQINGNVLWVSKLNMRGSFLIKTKNFHVGDINLFYENIREDLRTRVLAFLKK